MSWQSPKQFGENQTGNQMRPADDRKGVFRHRAGRWSAFFLLFVLVAVVIIFLVGRWVFGAIVGSLSDEGEGEIAGAATPVVLDPEPVTPPLSFEGFNAARIIEDEQFFNSDAYSLEQVAGFIAEWNEGCRTGVDGTVCLADYLEDTPSFEADAYCPGGFEGEEGDTAASIIWKAAQSCGINPQVLLTTLQKEQGLITASGYRLNETRYAIAMGYACPDSANCDPTYFGFATQVYYAARQFRVYEQNPEAYTVDAERQDFIPYAPGDCGGSEVFVENQATANLYNYTPYQPDEAALAGSAGPCSSVGNLNFYAYFNAWFGDEGVAAQSSGDAP